MLLSFHVQNVSAAVRVRVSFSLLPSPWVIFSLLIFLVFFRISSWPKSAFVPYVDCVVCRRLRFFEERGAVSQRHVAENQRRAAAVNRQLFHDVRLDPLSSPSASSSSSSSASATYNNATTSEESVDVGFATTTTSSSTYAASMPMLSSLLMSGGSLTENVRPDTQTNGTAITSSTTTTTTTTTNSTPDAVTSTASVCSTPAKDRSYLQFLERSCIDVLSSLRRNRFVRPNDEDQVVPASASSSAPLDLSSSRKRSTRSRHLRRKQSCRKGPLGKGPLDRPEITYDLVEPKPLRNDNDQDELARDACLYSSFDRLLVYSKEQDPFAERLKKMHRVNLYRTDPLRNNLTRTLKHLNQVERLYSWIHANTTPAADAVKAPIDVSRQFPDVKL